MDYLLKSSACMAAFYGLYFFGFRRLTFHALNRWYLLASLALSLTIPLLNYEREKVIFVEPNLVSESYDFENTFSQNIDNQTITNPLPIKPEPTMIDWSQVLTIVYLLGMGIVLLLLLKNILTILHIIITSNRTKIRANPRFDNVIYTNSRLSNASFFNFIFINSENLNPHEQALVVAHESYHSKLWHSLDLLLIGLLKAFFWFNPIIYFYQKSLKHIHEYEVDTLMSVKYDSRNYAHLLLKLGVQANSLIINQFSKMPLSDRIQFLFKKPTKNMKKLLYFLAIPILAVGVAVFAQEKVKVVYKEKVDEKTLKTFEVKEYPLIINDGKNYASWTGGNSGKNRHFDYTPYNLSLNEIQTKNYNGFHYVVNPNSLTINMISEVNEFIKNRFLALVITEKATDSRGNLTKLGLSIKHLRTNQMTQTEVFDMTELRELGKKGAFLFIEAYDKNFKESQMTFNYGTKNLSITKNTNLTNIHNFYISSESSYIRHSKDKLEFRIYPDKMNLQAFDQAKDYFEKNGLSLKVNNFKNDKNSQLESINLAFEKDNNTFVINKLRHLVRLKSKKKDKGIKIDDALVLEADLNTKATKMYIQNLFFEGIEKSGKWEILKVVSNEKTSQNSNGKFSFPLDFNVNLANIDSFYLYQENRLLIEGTDFILKENKIYLSEKQKGIKAHFYSHSGPDLLYPNLAKLDEIPFSKLQSSTKPPIILASKDNKILPINLKIPSFPSNFNKNVDSIRTLRQTKTLGKNPLVIINNVEYPASILYRIDPKSVSNTGSAPPNNERAIATYGEKARDGFIKINTRGDFLFKSEKAYQVCLENLKKELITPPKRVQRIILKKEDDSEYEKIIINRQDKETLHFSIDVPKNSKVLFLVDGKQVSEEYIEKSDLKFIGGSCGEGIDEDTIKQYGEIVKGYDGYFALKTIH